MTLHLYSSFAHLHCPTRNQNFRDITRNVEENEILHEIFPFSISFIPLHFLLYLGKSITFETVWDSPRGGDSGEDMNQLTAELGLDPSRPLPHVRISSKMADTSHSASAVQLFYSQLTKPQVGGGGGGGRK